MRHGTVSALEISTLNLEMVFLMSILDPSDIPQDDMIKTEYIEGKKTKMNPHGFCKSELQQALRRIFRDFAVRLQTQNIILVGRDILSTIDLLKEYSGLDIASMATVMAIIDVVDITYHVLESNAADIDALLRVMDLRYLDPRNTVDDSRSALKGFLEMYCANQWFSMELDECMVRHVRRIEAVAQFGWEEDMEDQAGSISDEDIEYSAVS